MIKFGTDGWRGLIARDFTFENLRKVALATANLLLKRKPEGNKVVIGYDTRFLSKEFALETAQVLASKGIAADVSDDISSTPMASFATKERGADLGVVITASHNPAEYSGYKVKANFGGPAAPEEVAALEDELKLIWGDSADYEMDTVENYIKQGKITLFDAKTPFLNYLREKIDFDTIKKSGVKVLFDPMHGAGIDTMKHLLPDTTEIHDYHNPGFGEVDHPEPIENCLEVQQEMMRSGNFDIGIATDGDADRLGLFDNEGNFVDSHKIYMILLKYLYEEKGVRGEVAKTVSLTTMVNLFCEKHGITLHETAVGFKHIAKLMVEKDIIIGGEESGGLSTIVHIPERDGIFNALMILEIMAVRGKSLKELCSELDEEFGPHRFARRDVRVTRQRKEEILAAAAKEPSKLGNYEVVRIQTTDGYKYFVDGGWLLIRASGTEPLIRFYSEAKDFDMVNELLDAGFELR